jgi:hypothetical protein
LVSKIHSRWCLVAGIRRQLWWRGS